MDLAKVKEGVKRFLPVLETIARLTPNKADDAAVQFLKTLLSDEQKLQAAVDAANAS